MSDKENLSIIETLDKGLEKSFENLLHRKAALGQDMVFADTYLIKQLQYLEQ